MGQNYRNLGQGMLRSLYGRRGGCLRGGGGAGYGHPRTRLSAPRLELELAPRGVAGHLRLETLVAAPREGAVDADVQPVVTSQVTISDHFASDI